MTAFRIINTTNNREAIADIDCLQLQYKKKSINITMDRTLAWVIMDKNQTVDDALWFKDYKFISRLLYRNNRRRKKHKISYKIWTFPC